MTTTTHPITAPPSLARQGMAFLQTIKFSHTFFSLPFALSAVLLAWPRARQPQVATVVWVVLAVVTARVFAMGVNRLADRRYDATNPRTQDRPLVSGQLTTPVAAGLTAAGLLGFALACWGLGGPCLALCPVVAVVLGGYSFFKRFSWTCHFWLGLCLALAPAGAWVAVTGGLAGLPVALMLAVGTWVAGFDLVYAIADIAHDRHEKLHSFPVRFGPGPARLTSRGLHLASVTLLALHVAGHLPGPWHWSGLGLFGSVLLFTHLLAWRRPAFEASPHFLSANALASVGYFVALFMRWRS